MPLRVTTHDYGDAIDNFSVEVARATEMFPDLGWEVCEGRLARFVVATTSSDEPPSSAGTVPSYTIPASFRRSR